MHKFDDIYDFSFTFKAKPAIDASSIADIESITIHYKEATHTPKGELMSVTYNQLVLDKVILSILIEIQDFKSKTRKEYGQLFRQMFLDSLEMVHLQEQTRQVEN